MKKLFLSLMFLVPISFSIFPVSMIMAGNNVIDEGNPVNEIVVREFTIKVSENRNYVYIFVHKNNHTVLATKFSK